MRRRTPTSNVHLEERIRGKSSPHRCLLCCSLPLVRQEQSTPPLTLVSIHAHIPAQQAGRAGVVRIHLKYWMVSAVLSLCADTLTSCRDGEYRSTVCGPAPSADATVGKSIAHGTVPMLMCVSFKTTRLDSDATIVT